MKKAFIIHGAYGNPEENWFPWLAEELKKYNYEVIVPTFPTPENQNLEAWMDVFQEHVSFLDKDTILIGHSIGVSFLLNILEKIENPIKASFFVAGFIGSFSGDYANPEFDEINKTFAVKDFSWKKIKKNGGKFHLYHGSNDPYVPGDKAIELSAKLGAPVQSVEGAGHFNEKAGYTKFKILLEDILKTDFLQYEEFQKLDARIGQILLVEPIEGADKLLRFEIDFGEESPRQIVSGIREFFPDLPDGKAGYKELEGKQALYVINLEPREIRGVMSHGMLMAVDGTDGNPVFLTPEFPVNPGSAVR